MIVSLLDGANMTLVYSFHSNFGGKFYLLLFLFSSISKVSRRLHDSPAPFHRGVLAIVGGVAT